MLFVFKHDLHKETRFYVYHPTDTQEVKTTVTLLMILT